MVVETANGKLVSTAPSASQRLGQIQKALRAPKSKFNKFGNFYYRDAEDIMEGIKPLLERGESVIVPTEIFFLEGRFYVKATARFLTGEGSIECTAYAREEDHKKGMDGSQVTGSATSYAKKFALSGLFLVDDSHDADSMNNSTQGEKPGPKKSAPPKTEASAAVSNEDFQEIKSLADLKGVSFEEIREIVSTQYGVASAKDLDKAQIEDLKNRLRMI